VRPLIQSLVDDPMVPRDFRTIYAQENPDRGKRGAGCDLSLKLNQSSTEEMEIKQ
jgi:hypothetical protein